MWICFDVLKHKLLVFQPICPRVSILDSCASLLYDRFSSVLVSDWRLIFSRVPFSFPVAVNEVQYSSTFKESKIILSRKRDDRWWHTEMGKQQSEGHWKIFSNREFSGMKKQRHSILFTILFRSELIIL